MEQSTVPGTQPQQGLQQRGAWETSSSSLPRSKAAVFASLGSRLIHLHWHRSQGCLPQSGFAQTGADLESIRG